MRKKTQKGGVLIKTNPEEAINFFIENSSQVNWLRETANSASGVIFECILKEGVASPYEMIRSTDFKSPVKKILIKFVGIRSEVRGEYDDDEWTVPFRATRILNADFISFYISLMSFFLYISYY
jgi:hypothetical protein